MKRKFINGLITALALGVISNSGISEIALADEKEIILDVNENDVKGYVNLESYVELTSGNYEKKIISEDEIVYVITIESSKSENVYVLELRNDRNNIKIGDNYIPCNFEKVAGYVVPNNSEKVIEKDGVLHIPFSFFEGLFNGKMKNVDDESKIILPSNLGDYIDENLEALKGPFEVKDNDDENETSEEDKKNEEVENIEKPVKPSKPNKPVSKPPVTQPVEPPISEPEKPADEGEEKPPVAEPEDPSGGSEEKPPVGEPENPSGEGEEKPPVVKPENPSEENGENTPIVEQEGNEEKQPIIEQESFLEENKNQFRESLT